MLTFQGKDWVKSTELTSLRGKENTTEPYSTIKAGNILDCTMEPRFRRHRIISALLGRTCTWSGVLPHCAALKWKFLIKNLLYGLIEQKSPASLLYSGGKYICTAFGDGWPLCSCPLTKGCFYQGKAFSLSEPASNTYVMLLLQKAGIRASSGPIKDYSTVTKYGVRDERVQSKDFLTNKMKVSIFHFREQGPTEVHPLFITSLGRGIIKVTEV